MRTAERFAAKSTCKRRQHGAVVVPLFVNPTVIVGWNHSLDNEPCKICIREAESIPSGTQYEKCNAIHAEQDAICEAAKWHGNIGGATLYITGCPCAICAKMIVAAGIARVVIGRRAPQAIEGVVDYLRGFGVTVEYLADLEASSEAECAACSNGSQSGNEDCEACPNRPADPPGAQAGNEDCRVCHNYAEWVKKVAPNVPPEERARGAWIETIVSVPKGGERI